MRSHMISLYGDVIKQKCELEKLILRNSLALATLHPDEFAHTVMKSAGYLTVTTGEIVHIVKCTPVAMSVRPSAECCQ